MMEKTRSLSIRTIVLLIASVVAITLTFTGTARAALAYFSPDYQAEFETTQLKVALTENGDMIDDNGALLTWIDNNKIKIVPGKEYKEELAAYNPGNDEGASYPEYVRVVYKKYWTTVDADGNVVKATNINPALIDLTESMAGWEKDEANCTAEQTVLYSVNPLEVGESLPFVTSFCIDSAVVTDAEARTVKTVEQDGKMVTITEYKIGDYSFVIEAEVDSVQTHSISDASVAVWGYEVR